MADLTEGILTPSRLRTGRNLVAYPEQEMAQLKARIKELRRNFMDVITPNGKTRRGGGYARLLP